MSRIHHAIENLDDELIAFAAVYKPEKTLPALHKALACAAAALLLVLAIGISPVSAQIKSWFSSGRASGVYENVALEYIPEGMTLNSDIFMEKQGYQRICFEDGQGNYLDIKVNLTGEALRTYDSEGASVSDVLAGDMEATLLVNAEENFTALYWQEDGCLISVEGNISKDEAIRIANGFSLY